VLKSATIYLFFAALLLMAKPFLGFSIFSSTHPPADESIFVKAFTKRKQEYVNDSQFDMSAVQKKLAHPAKKIFLFFAFLLGIIFPVVFAPLAAITTRFLRYIQLSLSPREHPWLLNGILVI
jgi:hypothetical protein